MSHNTQLSAAVGSGDEITDYDLVTGGVFPTTGKVACSYLFISAANGTTPTPLFAGQQAMASSLPVVIASNQSGIPVTGTFWQATQPVSAASLPLPSGAATAANQATEITGLAAILSALQGTIAVSGTFWQATQPVSAASLPLPSGASTAAKQPALGTAGSASSDVITVQGITSMTPLLATVTFASAQAVTQSGTWNITNISGTVSLPTGAATAAKQPALGTAGSASADVITVQGVASMTPLLVTASIASAQTLATVTTVSTVTSLSQWAGNGIDTNSGNKSAGTLRVVLATDQPALANKLLVTADPITFASAQAVTQSGTWTVGISAAQTIAVTNAGTFATQATLAAETTKVIGTVNISAAQTVGLAAGSQVIGHVIVDSGTITTVSTVTAVTTVSTVTSVTAIANALPSGTNNIGQVSLAPQTSNGLSCYSVNSSGAANQDEAAVKGSAGQVYGYSIFNTTASARYVKLYNLASGATSGSTPTMRIYLPPTGGANLSMENGIAFGTGICIRITTGAADSDTGSCSANDVLANIYYK